MRSNRGVKEFLRVHTHKFLFYEIEIYPGPPGPLVLSVDEEPLGPHSRAPIDSYRRVRRLVAAREPQAKSLGSLSTARTLVGRLPIAAD